MEESQVVKEIVNALQFYSERTDEKIEKRLQLHSDQIDKKLEQILQAYSEQIDEKLEKRLQSHSGQIGKKLEHLENQLNEGFKRVDKRLDNLDKKFTGLRVELTETQETVNFLSSKSAQHEKKLQNFYGLQS